MPFIVVGKVNRSLALTYGGRVDPDTVFVLTRYDVFVTGSEQFAHRFLLRRYAESAVKRWSLNGVDLECSIKEVPE